MPNRTKCFRGGTRAEAEYKAARWVFDNPGIVVVRSRSVCVTDALEPAAARQIWETHVRFHGCERARDIESKASEQEENASRFSVLFQEFPYPLVKENKTCTLALSRARAALRIRQAL